MLMSQAAVWVPLQNGAGAGQCEKGKPIAPSPRLLLKLIRMVEFAADSPLEEDGFELSVPGRETFKLSWETGLLSRKRERICWGTEGSNPSPSSAESVSRGDVDHGRRSGSFEPRRRTDGKTRLQRHERRRRRETGMRLAKAAPRRSGVESMVNSGTAGGSYDRRLASPVGVDHRPPSRYRQRLDRAYHHPLLSSLAEL